MPTPEIPYRIVFRPSRWLVTALLVAALQAPAMAEDLQALINRANEAANKDDYATAIPLYEQAVQRAPKETVLQNNLVVLYVNHAVALQEKKDYVGSVALLDKALALNPHSKPAQEAKAGTFFYMAMDLKNEGSTDFSRIRTLLEQAMALNPSESAFKQAMAGVYLEEAYPLATAERFTEAAELLEKALTYDPQHRTARQSLANVYLGLASQQPDKQQEWADKALAIDNSPRIQQLRDQILAGQSRPVGQAAGDTPAYASPQEARAQAPKDIGELSVAEMMAVMERQLGIEVKGDTPLIERLEAVEERVLGKSEKGPLAVRAKTVYTALMGSYDGSVTESNPQLVQAPVLKSENHYLDEIFKITEGKVVRWGKFPLRVYVEEPKDNPLWKPFYKEAALHGFNAWKVKTNGFANYVEVKDANAADVVVTWQEEYTDRFADPDTAPDYYKNYTPPQKTKLMKLVQLASMLTPGYYGLAPQAINAAMQYQQYKKLDVVRQESKITLGLAPAKDLPEEQAKVLIQNMAAKEFGHVLGLKGASPQPGDLLYPDLRHDVVQLPSARDLETLRQLYNRPPNIILNVQ